ncbi:MAG: mannitol dehydrogenase family protein [Primorskyibacter sp.]
MPRLHRTAPAARTGIVHLGPGAFFRAFNAVYTQDAQTSASEAWGILAVSLRSPTARDHLSPQDGAYTAITRSSQGDAPRVIQSVTDVIVASDDPGVVVARMADPSVRIVSLTITEKGYCHTPATGDLDAAHPDIQHDLAHPDVPRSAIGVIVAALARRRAGGQAPFTVMSCDNLPSNGALTRRVVLAFARLCDPGLAQWIADTARFPATMVDRITPATTPDDVAGLARQAGYYDPGCVVHEAFRQWVIQDDFPTGRPAWEHAGAQLVACVDAHEVMKLRCLNGTHSTLAYLGYLAGYDTIADVVADPDFAALCRILWRVEILPTVPPPQGADLTQYCVTLLERYRDSAIRHRTWQIAMDGSLKLPQRILGTIRDRLAVGQMPFGLCLAVAGWMRYVGGVDDIGGPIDVRDPLATRLRAASDSGQDAATKVDALLAIPEVFGTDLPAQDAFRDAVVSAYHDLSTTGAKAAVHAYVAGFTPDNRGGTT